MKNTNRSYKDSLFRMIFSEKEALLSLYNALNGTCYKEADELTINTLEDAYFMSYKNDSSFILGGELSLFEHQSTICGNMPLRCLLYIGGIYSGYIMGDKDKRVYKEITLNLPEPRCIVFYNGIHEIPEKEIHYLSDAFESKSGKNLELKVTVYNINKGYNKELLQACKDLEDYCYFVNGVRDKKKLMPLKESIIKTVDECITEGVMRDFLLRKRAEVENMSIWEYDEEEHMEYERQLAMKEGREAGHKEGHKEGYQNAIKEIAINMSNQGMSTEAIASILKVEESYITEILEHNR